MKPFYLSSFLLFCLCSPVSGQLVDQIGNHVEGVTRELERVSDDVQDQVRKAAEDELTRSSLLANPLDDSPLLDNPLTDALDRTVTTVGQTTQGVTSALAASLSIVNRRGDTVLVEVRVDDNWRAVEREWLMLMDAGGMKVLVDLDVEVIEQSEYAGLGLQLVRFRVPPGLDSVTTLKQHLPRHLHDQLDRNHIYVPQADDKSATSNRSANPSLSHKIDAPAATCSQPVRVGMIDTAINTQHPAFAQSQSRIESKDFAGDGFEAPRAHGTAVAGILVGRHEQLIPLLPAARLFAASVFYPRNEYTQGATMINLVRALNWLVEQKVIVINMSLAGPDNKILALAIQKTIQSGIAITAAAGNEGPAAPPAYPAAYPDVIAVTAVDNAQKIYRWANRGAHIDFAAIGVGVLTARSTGELGKETGTSMAAPKVTAAVACIANGAQQPLPAMLEALKQHAIDLGAPGRDPVFGDGLLNSF